MHESNEQWVSVSTLAKMLGVSKQTCYNKIKQGIYASKTFQRGSMNGILVCAPTDSNLNK